MKTLGIIAEYNPFHNGHKYHLERSKEITGADVTVAVMSGNFVQRGEPALYNKWVRSEMAVKNGIDLVLELPFVYACNNAELFAKGSISLINSLGCVNYLSFGSEAGQIQPLSEVVSILEPESEEFSKMITDRLKEGMSYASARQETVDFLGGEGISNILESPNNILGVEYLKQLKVLNSDISPITVKRYGASINEASDEVPIAGATAIRKMFDMGEVDQVSDYLPKESIELLKKHLTSAVNFDIYKEMVIYSIISKRKNELAEVYSITEGLEHKVAQAARTSKTITELIGNIKSKRYAETRIKRILIHVLTGLTRQMMNKIIRENQMYARVLAFNEKGASLIKRIKKSELSSIPIITNISKEANLIEKSGEMFHYDILAADIYNLVSTGDIYVNSEYRKIPTYIRE